MNVKPIILGVALAVSTVVTAQTNDTGAENSRKVWNVQSIDNVSILTLVSNYNKGVFLDIYAKIFVCSSDHSVIVAVPNVDYSNSVKKVEIATEKDVWSFSADYKYHSLAVKYVDIPNSDNPIIKLIEMPATLFLCDHACVNIIASKKFTFTILDKGNEIQGKFEFTTEKKLGELLD